MKLRAECLSIALDTALGDLRCVPMYYPRVISEAEYAALVRIIGQKFFRPKYFILRPSCESVSAKAMYEDNTRKARQSAARYERSLGLIATAKLTLPPHLGGHFAS
jgi:hypothetical protein